MSRLTEDDIVNAYKGAHELLGKLDRYHEALEQIETMFAVCRYRMTLPNAEMCNEMWGIAQRALDEEAEEE